MIWSNVFFIFCMRPCRERERAPTGVAEFVVLSNLIGIGRRPCIIVVDHNARTRIKCDMTTDISWWGVDPPAKSEGGSSLSPVGRDNDSQTGLPIHHRVRFSALFPPFLRGKRLQRETDS